MEDLFGNHKEAAAATVADPTVRLVANGHPGRDDAKALALGGPSVRLVQFDIPAVVNTLSGGNGPGAPTVRLVGQSDSSSTTRRDTALDDPHSLPALLVSYYYLGPFLKQQARYRYRDWVLDSGAFSAHNSGKAIDLSQYVDTCLRLLAEDPTLTEVFALDQIPASPSPRDVAAAMERSLRNTEEMWRQGVPAIPCYHCGEPEEALLHIAGKYPKIALGGMVAKGGGILSQDAKWVWLEQCFARVWPKRIHGFGVSGERIVYGLPFHSVDATNWEIAPCAFGNWQKFGTMSVRGSNQDLRSQVRHYLDMEAKARVKWARQMAELEALPDVWPPPRPAPSIRPGDGSASRQDTRAQALGEPASAAVPEPEAEAPAVPKEPKVRRERVPPPPPKRSSDALPELDQRWSSWRP
jgi:hypothetical protein